jgi:hypothetical protein
MSDTPVVHAYNCTCTNIWSIAKSRNLAEIVDSWDAAIRVAKQKIDRLKNDAVVFQEMKDSGSIGLRRM